MTEVLSVSSAASADKEMPGGGIRISADTIYRLRLISVAAWLCQHRRAAVCIHTCVEEYLESARQMPARSQSSARNACVVVFFNFFFFFK